MIVSFGWTSEALEAGVKTATSRQWKASYRQMWQRAYDRGDRRHKAYDKSPRAGGSHIGWITLVQRPRLKHLRDFTEEEVRAEGVGLTTVEEWTEWMEAAGVPPSTRVTLLRFIFEPL